MSDENPYTRRKAKSKNRGIRAEARTARRIGGSLTPASGSIAGAKGDIRRNDFLIENKSTVNGSLGLKLLWLRKISGEALAQTKSPAVSIQFTDDAGRPIRNGAWVMIPEQTFEELVDAIPEDAG